ncbi:MAG: hypothetical protein NC920_02365 [Candidatus Omnitrophica bacterium]|nr:hypothetical protein [Candidatus Omnitrophota bacterium]MCM8798949.1 hypothetical protein [Candidatus Omnitrophota bacterium]
MKKRCSLGFTFVELFLVLILIAVIILLSLPRFRPTFQSLELLNLSKKLSSLMRYAQSRAIAEGKPLYLFYRKEKNTFMLTEDPPEEKERKVLEQRFLLSLPENVKVETKDFIFYPEGRIDIVKTKEEDKAEIVLSNEITRFKITAQGAMGKIEIEEIYD